MRRLLVSLVMAAVTVTGCSGTVDNIKQQASDSVRKGSEQAFVAGVRSAAPQGSLDDYTDDQILQFGKDACNKLQDAHSATNSDSKAQSEVKTEVPDGVPQIQWDLVVTTAASILCDDSDQ